ncbi:MAG: hypothetical protein K2W99_00500 [Chthoniobacterales bacterium]|nr:hypothetical protein [Chthoniobacterales bacterium]
MIIFLFLLLFLPSLLSAQEATVVPKIETSAQTQTPSPSQASALSPVATSSAEPVVTPEKETNAPSPEPSSASSPSVNSVTPVDPSAEVSQELTPSSTPAVSEESTAGDTNAPIADQAEEPLKAPLEKPPESIEKKEGQIKIRYYQVRARVENDPEVAAIKQQANTAVSDERKRQALRAYYELLFKKMKSIDASISDRCDTMQAAYLRRLEQSSLEPTVPLTPFVSPSPSTEKKETTPTKASPTPAPTISKKKKRHSLGNS